MGGNMRDAEITVSQHHAVVTGVGQRCIDFGVSRKMKAGGIEGRFIYRAGDRSVDVATHGQINDPGHVFVRCPALIGRYFFIAQALHGHIAHVQNIQRPVFESGIPHPANRIED